MIVESVSANRQFGDHGVRGDSGSRDIEKQEVPKPEILFREKSQAGAEAVIGEEGPVDQEFEIPVGIKRANSARGKILNDP
jgi:hypothetical protein